MNVDHNHMNAAKPELSAKAESVREFISTAVHDFREPIRSIRAGAGLLEAQSLDLSDENAARNLRFIHQGADRLERLVRDISTFLYEENRAFESADIPLESAVRAAQQELAPELRRQSAELVFDSLPEVKGDLAALTTVFQALIDNACKFRSEAAPTIQIGAERQDDEWVVSVRDNGIGFKSDYLEQLFRPFRRLNGKEYPGSGLGLAMVKRIVERHGGRIWAESQLGNGSVFYFSLPAA